MNTGEGNAYINWGQSTCQYCGAIHSGFHSCSNQQYFYPAGASFAYCSKHNTYYNGSGCSVCAAVATECAAFEKRLAHLEELLRRQDIVGEANYSYSQNRFDAFYEALNHASVRIDLAQAQLDDVADQADRSDAAQTELESRLLDLQDAHNKIEARLREAESLLLSVEERTR